MVETRRGAVPSGSNVRYRSGHETFPFRYAWLPKGIQSLRDQPGLFTEENAIVTLGVGKNMVRSIRYWCETLGLIELPRPGSQARPTQLGTSLFGSRGWDPYLEDPGTLWLLHWLLVSRRERASTWYLAFTQFNLDLVTAKDLVERLAKVIAETPGTRGTPASLRRDVEVFLRTYTVSHTTRDIPLEDTFDCPLVELGLLREAERGIYQFNRGPKPSLPQDIFVYALLDFWHQSTLQQQTLSFEWILHDPGSPGRAFKFSENALVEHLERLPPRSQLTYNDTAGKRLVLRKRTNTGLNLLEVLKQYYRTPLGEQR
jgi:hypothetical protein